MNGSKEMPKNPKTKIHSEAYEKSLLNKKFWAMKPFTSGSRIYDHVTRAHHQELIKSVF